MPDYTLTLTLTLMLALAKAHTAGLVHWAAALRVELERELSHGR